MSEKNVEQKPAKMWHGYKKPKTQPEEGEGEDPDSDYAPSDGEGEQEGRGPAQVGSSVSATSSTSPEKLIAVSIIQVSPYTLIVTSTCMI